MKAKPIIVYITCSSKKEAELIAGSLLKKRLAACVNAIGPVTSKFWWNAKVDRAQEVMLMCKTTEQQYKAVQREVRRLHSYEVPEVIAVPIVAGSAEYLRWIRESVA